MAYGALARTGKALALAQSVLRGQSLSRRHPDWVRELVAVFAADPQLTTDAALERISGVDNGYLASDLSDALAVLNQECVDCDTVASGCLQLP